MKKLLSLALALVMVVSLTIPTAWASGGGADSSVTNGAYEDGVWSAGGNGTAHYEDSATGLDLDLSKTAKPVEGNPTAFDVTLQVKTRMTTTTTPPGSAATVLVFDRSDSMKDRIDDTTRLAAAKKAAVDFINGTNGKPGYKGDTPGTGRYLALVVFARDAEVLVDWVDVSNPASAAKVVNTINGLGTKGQTNHDDGLRKASALLEKDIVSSIPKEQKNVIMLTDGKPTYSHSYSKRDGERMIQETANTAAALRQETQIYTICFAAQNERCYSGSSLTVGEFLRTKIATPAAASQKYAYNADNVNELNAAFAAITQSVVSGVNGAGWVITDPMAKDVSLDHVISRTGKTQTTGSTLKWTIGNPVVTQDGAAKVYTYTLTYRINVDNTGLDFDEDVFHPLNKNTYVTIGSKQYAFPVPGVKVEAPRYTVTYQAEEGGSLTGAGSDGKVIHTGIRRGSETPAAPVVVCDEGCYFTGWTPAIQKTVTGDATYTAQFAEKQTLTVQANSGSFTYDGKSHTVTGLEKTSFVIDGQTYTVKGLSATGSTEFGTAAVTVTGTARVMQGSKDVTDRFTVLTENGKITVNPRTVTLISKNAAKAYDGTPLQMKEVEVKGQGFAEGESFVYSDFASITDVGTAENTFQFAAGPNTDLKHYAVTVKYGDLTVSQNKNEIIIIANDASKIYDGTPLTEKGFTFTQDILAKGDELTVTVEGTITDAGTAVNRVTGYKVMRGTKDVTDFYTFAEPKDGKLTVLPRALTLTSKDGEKIYDGTPLQVKSVTVSEPGFVDGEGAAYHNFASIIDAGDRENTFDYTLNKGTKAANYTIEKKYGNLGISCLDTKLEIIAASDSKMYDGTPLSNDGFEVTKGVLVGSDRVAATVEGSATHVGDEGANTVEGYTILRGEDDVTENYSNVELVDGKLEITPRPVELTSATAARTYNGEPLKAEEVVVGGQKFAPGEGAIYSNFASITNAGSMDNTFSYSLQKGTRADDYDITMQKGTLTVYPIAETLLVSAKSDSKTYDGAPLTNDGYTFTQDVLADGDELSVTVKGTITNVGETVNKITSCRVLRGTDDVTANYSGLQTQDGKLTISKRPVTLISADASKIYDGQPLMAESVKVEGDGFAPDEGADYSNFASITDVGSVANTFTATPKRGTDFDNYSITKSNGTLTVTKNEDEIFIRANSASKIYDGTPLTEDGYTFTQGILADGDELTVTVEGTITNAGTAVNQVTGYKVMRGTRDVTDNYTFAEPQDGTLTVAKRDVVLTSDDGSKIYDGQPLTAETVVVSGAGFADGEGATYSDFASITDAGEKTNTFDYTLNKNTQADNYTITQEFGQLTITARDQKLLVKANSANKMYDGQPLTLGTYTYTPGVLAIGDELVVQVEGSATHVGDEGINKIVSVKVMRGDEDATKNYTGLDTEDGKLTINKREVFLASDSASKIYDGQPLTAETVKEKGSGFVDGEGATYSNFASITDVGTVENTFKYTLNENTKSSDYNIAVNPGKLIVTPLNRALVITAASDSKIYDGEPLTNGGYDYTNKVLADGDRLVVTVEGSATHVGDEGVNKIVSVKVMRGDEDVTANYGNIQTAAGTLTITKRDVVLTSATDSKIYDGQPLTAETVAVSGSGFVKGEGADYSNFASITDVGTVNNTFDYRLAGDTRADDYAISVVNGQLTVTASEDEIVIVADSDSKIYDGQPLTNSGYTFNEDALAEGDVLTATVEGTITNAGEAANTVTGYKIMRGNVDVTDNYAKISTVPGKLTVAPREVTLTSGTAERVYNGQPLVADTVEAVGFVSGEGARYSDFASITDVGTAENTFAYDLKDNTLAENYTIKVVNGTLTVTPVTTELKITAASDSKIYDGQALTNDGFSVTEGVLIPGDEVVATVEGTITNAGETANTITAYQVMRGDVDVTANYSGITTEDGLLTVTKRDVTLTSASDSKMYDGQPLMAETVDAVGFVDGEGAQYMDFAFLVNVGQTENTFVYALNENTLADNYNITKVNGILTVNLHTNAKLEATGYTGIYDGAAHDGVTSTAIIDGVKGDEWICTYSTDGGETFVSEMPQYKDVGTYTVYVKATNDNYAGDALTVAVNVTITPATIVVTADSHTIATGDVDPQLSYMVETPVETETPAFTGSLVRANGNGKGVYAIHQGTLALTNGEDFLAANYVLEFVPGELTILQRDLAVTKTADKDEVTVGEKIVYTITVKNTGEVDLTNVVVTDEMLGVEETIAKLAVGEQRTFEYTYTTTKADEGKTLVNAVTVTADGGVIVDETAETEVIPAVPDTGDQSTLGLWTAALLLSAGGLVVLAKVRKKTR